MTQAFGPDEDAHRTVEDLYSRPNVTKPTEHTLENDPLGFRSDPELRMHWLTAFGRLVNAHTPRLCQLAAEEVHKPYFEALTGDVLALLTSIRWHSKHARGVLASRTTPGTPWFLMGQRSVLCRQPLGTVGIIATWNYPIQLLGIQLVAAIVGGNKVVVKPSERCPQTQGLLLDLARQALQTAGMPPQTITVLPATREAGAAMLADHDSGGRHLDHVVFTGSTTIGRTIAAWGAEALVPTTLELSGCDSAIVLDDCSPALVSLAAKSIWNGVTMNAGQTCMAPRRVLVASGVADDFVRAIRPLAAAAEGRTLIDAAAAARCFELAQDAVNRGATTASGTLEAPIGASLRPLCLLDCPPDCPAASGDHFGPLLCIIRVADEAGALRLQHKFGQHLSVSVYTGNPRRVRQELAGLLGASQVNINDTLLPTAIPGTSIAGAGPSGWGASRGGEGLLAMTRQVAVSTTSLRLRAPLEKQDDKFVRRFAGFMKWMFR